MTAYFPLGLGKAVEPLMSKAPGAETRNAMESTYTMWEQRLGIRIARAAHEIHAAGASLEVAAALDLPLGSPVLVLERTSYTDDDKPLEVVEFHYRPERYRFSVTLPRTMPEPGAGIVERRDST
jgi:GntR family transcriptional regulator